MEAGESPPASAACDAPVAPESAFTVHETRQTDRAIFVHSSYHGDAGPPAPPPLPVPPLRTHDDGAARGSANSSGASALSSVFVMANSTVGAGVLSLPFAFQETGLLGGLLLCVAVGTVEALTLYVLSKFAERYSAVSYVALVRRALGRKLAAALGGVLVVAMFGACVAYLIILGDTVTSLVAGAGMPSWASDRHLIIGLLGLGVLLPMCLPRQMGALAAMNRVAVLGFLLGAGLVVFRGMQVALERPELMSGVRLFNIGYHTLFAIPILVFGFNCHAMVVTIFHELESTPGVLVPVLPDSPTAFQRFRYIPRPKTRKLVGMLGVIMTSTCMVMAVYVAVGASGYLAFPGSVDANILKTFPQDDLLLQIARAFISIIVLGSYPLTHHPARAGFEHLVKPARLSGATVTDQDGHPAGVPVILSVAFTLVFVLGSTAVAEVVEDLGSVLRLLGGLCTSFIIFFLPGLLLINAAMIKHSTEVLETLEGQNVEGQVFEEQVCEEVAAANNLKRPLLTRLHTAREKGIKKGIIYAPRLSWIFGSLLIALGLLIGGVTIVTIVLGS
ncbi:hypothetical protein PLESTB_000940900 [Pleodorina starrii]|uniref:Amino acid transporter transmembrane domain-containing protein n=1 Tax=Pleodorina starrii TaxID=330485 RepID=A0A9W6BNK4_9CHLO|nr:hypothetical protein PLESTM_000704300 [Pleodorina starrii]GLC55075.1 hypothetical protein PLESTB_000940900 [Pleodorina starrii]GLC71170.1 hypothetical protein PLESTF_001082000 [Pleodorina starrii]